MSITFPKQNVMSYTGKAFTPTTVPGSSSSVTTPHTRHRLQHCQHLFPPCRRRRHCPLAQTLPLAPLLCLSTHRPRHLQLEMSCHRLHHRRPCLVFPKSRRHPCEVANTLVHASERLKSLVSPSPPVTPLRSLPMPPLSPPPTSILSPLPQALSRSRLHLNATNLRRCLRQPLSYRPIHPRPPKPNQTAAKQKNKSTSQTQVTTT